MSAMGSVMVRSRASLSKMLGGMQGDEGRGGGAWTGDAARAAVEMARAVFAAQRYSPQIAEAYVF
jgi:hypothetical protein